MCLCRCLFDCWNKACHAWNKHSPRLFASNMWRGLPPPSPQNPLLPRLLLHGYIVVPTPPTTMSSSPGLPLAVGKRSQSRGHPLARGRRASSKRGCCGRVSPCSCHRVGFGGRLAFCRIALPHSPSPVSIFKLLFLIYQSPFNLLLIWLDLV